MSWVTEIIVTKFSNFTTSISDGTALYGPLPAVTNETNSVVSNTKNWYLNKIPKIHVNFWVFKYFSKYFFEMVFDISNTNYQILFASLNIIIIMTKHKKSTSVTYLSANFRLNVHYHIMSHVANVTNRPIDTRAYAECMTMSKVSQC